jgi:hypothetical protein
MRRRRPISGIEMKKPAADVSARVEPTHFDGATLPVICPTCQMIDAKSITRPPRQLSHQRSAFSECRETARQIAGRNAIVLGAQALSLPGPRRHRPVAAPRAGTLGARPVTLRFTATGFGRRRAAALP